MTLGEITKQVEKTEIQRRSRSGFYEKTGKLNELHTQTMPGKKAMVVISNGKSMKETGILYKVLKELEQAGVEWQRMPVQQWAVYLWPTLVI